MRRLLAFFIDRPLLVNLLMVMTVAFGIVTAAGIPRVLIPAIPARSVSIVAELPGSTAMDMERFVTFRIEEVLGDLEGLKEITSTTTNGRSQITLRFRADHEHMPESLERAKANVESIHHVLPRDLRPINVTLIRQDRMPGPGLFVRGADEADPDHRQAIELMEERLLRLPWVVEVQSSLRRQHLHISFDGPKLDRASLDVLSARRSVAEFLRYAPVGQVRVADEAVAIQVDKGFDGLSDLEALPLIMNRAGRGVRLKDVATVELRFEDEFSRQTLDGKPYVSLEVLHSPDGDAVTVSERVAQVVEEEFASLHPDLDVTVGEAPSDLIEHELGILKSNGLSGVAIVLLILLIFLGWRIAGMTAIGLPFCYLGAMLLFDVFGITFDLISIAAMILVLGILVDDAIIVAEAFADRLQQGLSPRDAAVSAAHDMFRPVLGMMLTTAFAFAPLIVLKSDVSAVMRALPIVVLSTLALSFFESFFLLPNHLHDFVPADYRLKERSFVRWMRRGYERFLAPAVKLRYGAVAIFLGLAVLAGWLVSEKMEVNLNISLSPGVMIHLELPESGSLEETEAAVRPIEEFLDTLVGDEVRYYQTRVGGSYVANNRVRGFRYASITVAPPGGLAEREAAFESLDALIEPVLEQHRASFAELYVTRYGGQDTSGKDVISIYVSGSDKLDFREIQDGIRGVLDDVEGVEDVYMDEERLQRSWAFRVDHSATLQYGLSPEAIAAQLRERVEGPHLERIRLRGDELLVYTHFEETLKPEEKALRGVTVMTPRGIPVAVSNLGRWEEVEVLREIEHKDTLRVFTVDVMTDDDTEKQDVMDAVEPALAPLREKWPGFHISVEQNEAEVEGRKWALKTAVVTLGLMYLCLALSLNSLVQPLLVMAAVPFGVVGVILALYMHGMDFEIMAIIGILGLVGVVVNDSLVVLDTVRRRREKEPDRPMREVVIEGASSRFQAVVLTSLTTLGGVFPLAYGLMGDAGWIRPMVFALGWGLLFATLLTLVLLPCLLVVLDDLAGIGRWLKTKAKRPTPE